MPNPKSALIIVDVQNDFCPGGKLAVPHGNEVVNPIEKMAVYALRHGWKIFASRDWHPEDTTHFSKYGGAWPEHCVQHTPGADFHHGLLRTKIMIILDLVTVISKGMRKDENAYSAFEGRDEHGKLLEERLKEYEVEKIYIAGLATDYCVKATALDAKRNNYETCLLLNACRAVNLELQDGEKAVEEMRQVGVIITSTDEILF